MRIGLIGAGMAGLSCAMALRDRGHDTVSFDKGRGPGGRMSTRRIDTSTCAIAFDHGAQYFTARDPDFIAQVETWAEDGHVARWPGGGSDAWVGTPAMNAPERAMAAAVDVHWAARVESLSHDGKWHLHGTRPDPATLSARPAGTPGALMVEAAPFDAVVLAVPAEQVAPLIDLQDREIADLARSIQSDPCWTVMVAFDDRIPLHQDRLTGIGIIGSAVRNSSKPGRTAPEAWVLQATAEWSRDHLEADPSAVEQALFTAFEARVGTPLPAILTSKAHRWRFAKSGTAQRDAIWRPDTGIGVCGDWLIGPRIEAAWLSGRRLAALIG